VRATTDVGRSPWTRRLVTILVEAAARWPHVVRRELSPLLLRHPDAVIVAGGQAIAAFAPLEDLDVAVLEAVEARIPDGRHVDLDVGVAVLTERLTAHRLMNSRDDSIRAELFHKLSRRLANAGRYQEALGAAEAAESAIRSWEGKNRVKVLPELLATTVADRASFLSNLGRIYEAIAAARAAVDALSGACGGGGPGSRAWSLVSPRAAWGQAPRSCARRNSRRAGGGAWRWRLPVPAQATTPMPSTSAGALPTSATGPGDSSKSSRPYLYQAAEPKPLNRKKLVPRCIGGGGDVVPRALRGDRSATAFAAPFP